MAEINLVSGDRLCVIVSVLTGRLIARRGLLLQAAPSGARFHRLCDVAPRARRRAGTLT
jgi:hypothetical protein